jgi:hypothetical protein
MPTQSALWENAPLILRGSKADHDTIIGKLSEATIFMPDAELKQMSTSRGAVHEAGDFQRGGAVQNFSTII